jgi:hypothetical protein
MVHAELLGWGRNLRHGRRQRRSLRTFVSAATFAPLQMRRIAICGMSRPAAVDNAVSPCVQGQRLLAIRIVSAGVHSILEGFAHFL